LFIQLHHHLNVTNKKISLHQPSDIIKLEIIKRKEKDVELILLFAIKTDRDTFLLEINGKILTSIIEDPFFSNRYFITTVSCI
jgi:hypothetical protein